MKEKTLHIRAQTLLTCKEVIQCIFDLNPLEIQIFRMLTREGGKSAEEIGDALGKDRSTAYRALRQLQSCRICYKETVSLEQGGYQHIYYVVTPEQVRDEMEVALTE